MSLSEQIKIKGNSMISISKYFLENANVPGSVVSPPAPFGVMNPSEENNKKLAKAQNISKDPEKQVTELNKIRGS